MLKKKNLSPEERQFIEKRKDIVNLVFKHIEECEMLEKKRFSDKVANERKKLFASPTKGMHFNICVYLIIYIYSYIYNQNKDKNKKYRYIIILLFL